MNLNEKIERVESLETKQGELKNLFYDADRSKNSDEKKKLDKEIRKIEKEIVKVNDEYKRNREGRTINSEIGDSIADFLNRGKSIQDGIEEYTKKLNDRDISDEERQEIQSNIDKLNEDNSKLKSEIYDKAMEKTGLSWDGKTMYPTEIIKKHKETLSGLEAQKKELEAQKEKQKEIIEKNKDRIHEQFNLAIEKYQQMLDAGKISQELFDSRVKNMKVAKAKDIAMLDNSLENIDKNIESKNKEIEGLKGKITELEEKEKIFDEYNNAYYELFGETLDSYYIDNKERFESAKEKEQNVVKENKEKPTTEEKAKPAAAVKTPVKDEKQVNSENVVQTVASPVVEEPVAIQEEPKIVVTSKTTFDELYNKLTKGTISDKELGALTDALNDKANYDKYGITTGKVFSKARKILKYQGARTFKNIDEFLKNANAFSDDIKFDTSIENDEILSHEVLNSWKDVQNGLASNSAGLSIEKYIQKIEEYKAAGNELTDKQKKIYKEAMGIKASLSSYRKALSANGDVTKDREAESRNSVFYNMFRNKVSTKALPEVKENNSDEYIVNNDLFGIELNSMVNNETPEVSEPKTSSAPSRTKDTGEKVK